MREGEGTRALDSVPDRAWFAYHCLPRGPRGKLPSWRALEREHGIPQGLLSKLFSGQRLAGSADSLPKLARALRVTVAWLIERQGPDPRPPAGVVIPPRTGAEESAPRTNGDRAEAEARALAELLSVDADHMTPIEALQLVSRLQSMLRGARGDS